MSFLWSLILIQGEINRYVLEKKITPVIVIDEANHIRSEILRDIKMLFNFEMDSRDRTVVLLAGQPSVNGTLRLAVHEPLRQKIVMNYNMDAMSREECASYISERLKKAGTTRDIFDEAAVNAIFNASLDIPRTVNRLCNSSAVNDCELVGN